MTVILTGGTRRHASGFFRPAWIAVATALSLVACGRSLQVRTGDAAGIDAATDQATDVAVDRGAEAPAAVDVLDGGSAPQLAIRNAQVWANCMPAISADPILATWTVDITGAESDVARLTHAAVLVAGADATLAQELTVENPNVSLAGGSGSVEQRKQFPGTSPNRACDDFCVLDGRSSSFRLDLVFDIDGQSIATSTRGALGCAY